MKRHAYLIMAHQNFYVLEKLLLLLDDSRNDIYVHIDLKVKKFNFDYYKALIKKSNIYFLKKRINVKWGHSSQVKTELLLYETAYKNSNYFYYHLLSGADLPLKTQDYIHKFLNENIYDYIFYHPEPSRYDIARISRFHLHFENKNKITTSISNLFNIIQDIININRIKKYNFEIKRGYNWASLLSPSVEMILNKKKEIIAITFMSSCADELYKQLIIYNSSRRGSIYKNDEQKPDDLRLVDWSRKVNDSPYIWKKEDYYTLINSNKLFARKFSSQIDKEIVDEIYNYLISSKERY